MSRWRWYEPAPKQPVPDDGLRVDRFGLTWWGEQWIQALKRLGHAYANRLPRGRSYARAGRVTDLAIGSGEATAGVVGTRRRPYSVRIKLKTFSKQSWKKVIEILAGRARFSVALLRGEIPPEIGEVLGGQGIELFPVSGRDIETSCSCPDWANPCKHVAAVHYVVAAALDSDPYLIFVLRGLDRQALLGALAEVRGSCAPSPAPREIASLPEPLWEEPAEMDEELFLGEGRPLPQLAFNVAPAAVDLAGLARLGPPPPVLQDLPKRLGPGIRAASRAALALATRGDSPDERGTTSGDESVRDRVVDFIRSQPEGATMMLLRSRLPDEKKVLHRVVHSMRREGLLKSTGKGAAMRYTIARVPVAFEAEPTDTPSKGRREGGISRGDRVSGADKATGDEATSNARGLLAEQIIVALTEA
ncbi:MAG: SWIM zinc finger family protein, partial [Thermoanaerobaculales bacterium]